MPTDSETNIFIANLRDETQHRWFGMTDRISEGQWVFADGQNQAMTGYSNWNRGEPNNKGGDQDCAGYWRGKSTWDDMTCSDTKGFICQIDPGTHILRIMTSDVKDSQSKNALSVEILSDTCNGVCTTTTVSGLKARGTEYVRVIPASSFGDPTGLRLRALGRDCLKIDWVDIYNADTERFYRFSCRSDGCKLSTDQSEGSDQFLLDVDETHILRIRTNDFKESGSKNALAVKILSDTCNGVCTTTTVSGLNARGTVFVRSFSAPNLGDPTGLRLTAQGSDCLELDWIDVYKAVTGRYYRFSCRDIRGCALSTDKTEGFQQLLLNVDA
ncbi:uncharacterized protein LOC144915043 [Branchiostoma floridae x Branchiostoma belcheri]